LFLSCVLLSAVTCSVEVDEDLKNDSVAVRPLNLSLSSEPEEAENPPEADSSGDEDAVLEDIAEDVVLQEISPLVLQIDGNDVISGEVNLNGAGDVNLSSGVLYGLGTEELTEELSDELSDEDSVPRDEILTIVGEIPVVSEIDSAAPTNSVSVVSNTNSTGNDSGAIEEDIPSFEEWTKKVLAEEEKSGNYFIPFFTMIIICPMCFIRSV